jgi:hypothetical protein
MHKLIVVIAFVLASFHTSAAQENDTITAAVELVADLIDSDIDEAEKRILLLLEQYPNNSEINFLCGRIMGKQAGNAFFKRLSYAGDSLDCLKKAVIIDPEEPRYRKGLLNFYLGAPGIAGGSSEKAFEQVQAIKALNPYQGLFAEIDFHKQNDSFASLKESILINLQNSPSSPPLNFQLGIILIEEKQHNIAYEHFALATKNSANNIIYRSALYQIGRSSVFSGNHIEEGITALNQYLALDISPQLPSREWAHFRLSQLYQLAKDPHNETRHRHLAETTLDPDLVAAINSL